VKTASRLKEARRQGRKQVTMDDIAKALGVSKNSVSIALANKNGVSDALRRRVIEKANEMHYGGISGNFSTASRYIAVIVPEYLHGDTFFYAPVFWAVENEAKKRHCVSIHIGITKEMEETGRMPSLPRELEILGMLVVGIISRSYLEKLQALNLPMLSVDIAHLNPDIGCVGSANLAGGALATRYLIEMGHTKIGFIGPVNMALSIYERWCGFELAMRQANLKIEEDFNILGNGSGSMLFDTIEALEPFFENRTAFPTAWFCAGDRIAVALINVLAQKGLHVPDDVSVMGFDDLSIGEMILPRLSTVHVDRRHMGEMAVAQLCRLAADAAHAAVNINLPGTIVVRESVRTLPKNDVKKIHDFT